jgi:hypothetical protein
MRLGSVVSLSPRHSKSSGKFEREARPGPTRETTAPRNHSTVGAGLPVGYWHYPVGVRSNDLMV